MKKKFFLPISIALLVLNISCNKESDNVVLGGDQSPMGEVGVTVSSSSAEIAGVSNFNAKVTSLKDGISTYTASATVTNTLLKNMVANFPGVTIDGDNVSITGMEIQQTKEGIKSLTGPGAGILVKYDSKAGDTYPIGETGEVRTVVSNTGKDDYPYGFYLIKTIQVEMDPVNLKSGGTVDKYTFVSNHKFGLVGVKVTFDDQSEVTFPIYSSAQN
jgi:hypothetical protein